MGGRGGAGVEAGYDETFAFKKLEKMLGDVGFLEICKGVGIVRTGCKSVNGVCKGRKLRQAKRYPARRLLLCLSSASQSRGEELLGWLSVSWGLEYCLPV